MAIWRLITSDPDPLEAPQEALDWYINHGVIALGWDIADLRYLDVGSRKGIADLIDAQNSAEGDVFGIFGRRCK